MYSGIRFIPPLGIFRLKMLEAQILLRPLGVFSHYLWGRNKNHVDQLNAQRVWTENLDPHSRPGRIASGPG
jgi:hypothetical protein